MGNYTNLTDIGVKPARARRGPQSRDAEAGYHGTGGYFCPRCYDSAVAPTDCSTCAEPMLPRGRALMVSRDLHESSFLGTLGGTLGASLLVALFFTLPSFVSGTVWGARGGAPRGAIAAGVLGFFVLLGALIGWARWNRGRPSRRSRTARDRMRRHDPVRVDELAEGARSRVRGVLRVHGDDAWIEDPSGRVRVRVDTGTRAYAGEHELAALTDGDEVEVLGVATSVPAYHGEERVIAPMVILRTGR